jgi:hypothetical protein
MIPAKFQYKRKEGGGKEKYIKIPNNSTKMNVFCYFPKRPWICIYCTIEKDKSKQDTLKTENYR